MVYYPYEWHEVSVDMLENYDMRNMKTILLSLIVAENDDGYLARCLDIQGAFAEGDTIEEAIFNCVDVVKMIAQYRAERGESLAAHMLEMTPETQVAVSIPVGVG